MLPAEHCCFCYYYCSYYSAFFALLSSGHGSYRTCCQWRHYSDATDALVVLQQHPHFAVDATQCPVVECPQELYESPHLYCCPGMLLSSA